MILPEKIKKRDGLLDDPRVDPRLRAKCKAILSDLRGQDIGAVVIQSVRTPVQGIIAKATGHSKLELKSKHIPQGKRLCEACDIAFYWNDKITWDVPLVLWQKLGSAAKAHNLTWGGNWRMKDMNHVELRD